VVAPRVSHDRVIEDLRERQHGCEGTTTPTGAGYRDRVALSVVFETHATTVDNETGHATGWLPGELSETGRRQALELGCRRRDEGLDAVISSDLGRAVETVELAFGDAGLPTATDVRLRECNYGRLNGMAVSELHRAEHLHEPYPEGESWRQAADRVRSWLTEAADRYAGQRILVVGHSVTKWAFDEAVDGIPLSRSLQAPFGWQPGWEYRL
jgi:2,3-bisphosphoglycerate-dependent phosphoglycerate mutase